MSGPAAFNGHGLRRGAPPRTVIGVLADEATREALSEAAQQRGIPFAFELGTIETALAGLHPDEIADCVIIDLEGTPDAVDDVAVLAVGLPPDAELIVLGIFTEHETAELAQAGARLCLPKPLSLAAINRILGPMRAEPAPVPAQAPPPAPPQAYQPAPRQEHFVPPAYPTAPPVAEPPPQHGASSYEHAPAYQNPASELPPQRPAPAPAPTLAPHAPAAPPEEPSQRPVPIHQHMPAPAPEIPSRQPPVQEQPAAMDRVQWSANMPPAEEAQRFRPAPHQQPEPPAEHGYAPDAPAMPQATGAQRFAEPPPSYGAPPPRPNLAPGRVLSIVGCRGGVGASTIAVSLAWLIAEDFGRNTVLLDLDPHFGSIALALNLEPGDALQQALERPSRIDKVFLDRALRKVGQNLFVLCSEQSLDKPAKLSPAGPGALVRSLSARHERVIVDLPRSDPDVLTYVLALSDEIILVTDLSLAGARDAMRLMALVRGASSYSRIRIVGGGARDAGKSPILSPSEFRRAVGAPIDIAIAHDGETAMDAARSGRPLPKVFPRSPASKSLRNLAQSLEAHEQREPKRRLLFWKK